MAGFENTIVFSNGEKLQPSSATDIARMQEVSTDVARVNFVGNPNSNVAANPSSLCHDPVSGSVYVKQTGTGNTGWAALGTGSGTVTSVTGTTNRVTSTGGTTPQIDIDAAYVGQSSITTLGTVTTGTWQGTKVAEGFGGTNQSTYTTGDILYASAANTLSKRAIGSTNQIMTVSGGLPTWATSIYFSQINVQVITSSGTYTPTSGMKYATVEIIGGGGGGGGAASTSSTQVSAGAGGAGGQYTRKTVTAAAVGASQSITIGAGGSAGANTGGAGGGGGASFFGAIFQATGGNGGAGMTAQSVNNCSKGGAGSSSSGAGDFTSTGAPGSPGFCFYDSVNTRAFTVAGNGGSALYGGGGLGQCQSASGASAGAAGLTYGGGGSGAISGFSGTGVTGGAGAAGVCIITEFI